MKQCLSPVLVSRRIHLVFHLPISVRYVRCHMVRKHFPVPFHCPTPTLRKALLRAATTDVYKKERMMSLYAQGNPGVPITSPSILEECRGQGQTRSQQGSIMQSERSAYAAGSRRGGGYQLPRTILRGRVTSDPWNPGSTDDVNRHDFRLMGVKVGRLRYVALQNNNRGKIV